ncbi:hypothetical protein C0Q70_05549 [Pomacea canaliculata]|uniref:Uncharacterized protein n=1 Tax=Pomacea canaliculata TaxID=400727 RepID=A0A2T7PLJ3_POMCA|nr:hypothetical protein C0Q70_05549 [Pomacea canaliculata]
MFSHPRPHPLSSQTRWRQAINKSSCLQQKKALMKNSRKGAEQAGLVIVPDESGEDVPKVAARVLFTSHMSLGLTVESWLERGSEIER